MPTQEPTQESTLKKEKPEVQVVKPEPLKTLLTWSAPERPFKRRSREYFTTIGAIVFLLAVILLFLKEWLLIMVIVALMFVTYVMATIEPRKVEHKITNKGITTGGKTYLWQELGRFWFGEKWGQKILYVESPARFPRHLILLLGDIEEKRVKQLLSRHLSFEEPQKTWIDGASEWLSARVPLEKTD